MGKHLELLTVVFWAELEVVVPVPGYPMQRQPLYFASVDGRNWLAVAEIVDDISTKQVFTIRDGAKIATEILKLSGAKFLPATRVEG